MQASSNGSLSLYGDPVLATSNTKLASVYKFFELQLPRHNPAIVAEIFKWSDLQKGFRDPQPPRRVIWKFESNERDKRPREITTAYYGRGAHIEFASYLETLNLSAEEKAKLSALHSNSVAQAAREILDAREHLIEILKEVPDQVLWQGVFWGSG